MDAKQADDIIPQMSEQVADLFAALAIAQGEIEGAPKDRTNPHFGSQYATLSSVLLVAKQPLAKQGLSIVQMTGIVGGKIILYTMITHKSGQWIKFPYPLNPVKNDPQGQGSALTYARRYSYMAAVGMAPVDDDGEEAMGREAGGGQQGNRGAQNQNQGRGRGSAGGREAGGGQQGNRGAQNQGGKQSADHAPQDEGGEVPLLSLADFKARVDKGIQLNDAVPLVGKIHANNEQQGQVAAGYLIDHKIKAAANLAQLDVVSKKQAWMVGQGWLTEKQLEHLNQLGRERYTALSSQSTSAA